MYAELNRLVANMIKKGEVAEVKPGFVRVNTGGLVTDWLEYFVPAAGLVAGHRMPSIGEKCMIFSPSGDPAAGAVLTGLATNNLPSPSTDENITMTKYPDGAISAYNHATGALEFTGHKTTVLKSATSVLIESPETTVKGALTVTGPFVYQGGMTGSGGDGGGATSIRGSFKMVGSFTQAGGKMTSNGIVVDEHDHVEGVGKPI